MTFELNMTSDHTCKRSGDQSRESDEAVEQLIKRTVSEILGVSLDMIAPDTLLLELGAQSFDFVDLVVRLERVYSIEISPIYTVPDLHTIATYVKAVREGQARRGAAPRSGGAGSG